MARPNSSSGAQAATNDPWDVPLSPITPPTDPWGAPLPPPASSSSNADPWGTSGATASKAEPPTASSTSSNVSQQTTDPWGLPVSSSLPQDGERCFLLLFQYAFTDCVKHSFGN